MLAPQREERVTIWRGGRPTKSTYKAERGDERTDGRTEGGRERGRPQKKHGNRGNVGDGDGMDDHLEEPKYAEGHQSARITRAHLLHRHIVEVTNQYDYEIEPVPSVLQGVW